MNGSAILGCNCMRFRSSGASTQSLCCATRALHSCEMADGGCLAWESGPMDVDFQKARNSLHQLNNKVAQILAYAELMQLSLTGEKEKERIKLVIAGALECRQITAGLMNDMPKISPSRES